MDDIVVEVLKGYKFHIDESDSVIVSDDILRGRLKKDIDDKDKVYLPDFRKNIKDLSKEKSFDVPCEDIKILIPPIMKHFLKCIGSEKNISQHEKLKEDFWFIPFGELSRTDEAEILFSNISGDASDFPREMYFSKFNYYDWFVFGYDKNTGGIDGHGEYLINLNPDSKEYQRVYNLVIGSGFEEVSYVTKSFEKFLRLLLYYKDKFFNKPTDYASDEELGKVKIPLSIIDYFSIHLDKPPRDFYPIDDTLTKPVKK